MFFCWVFEAACLDNEGESQYMGTELGLEVASAKQSSHPTIVDVRGHHLELLCPFKSLICK